jgi:hypothetical protein
MASKKSNPYSDERRTQHGVPSVKVWPSAITPANSPLPNKTSKKSPTSK